MGDTWISRRQDKAHIFGVPYPTRVDYSIVRGSLSGLGFYRPHLSLLGQFVCF